MAMQVSVMNVGGMSCGHCVARIKKVVGAMGGVSSVSVDLEGKKVTVEFDPGVISLADIGSAIEELGYEVR